MTATLREKAACAAREVKLRKRNYARFIATGRMTPDKARHELRVMEAIASDYNRLLAAEEPALFADDGHGTV